MDQTLDNSGPLIIGILQVDQYKMILFIIERNLDKENKQSWKAAHDIYKEFDQ